MAEQKLTYNFNPYTFARISAMKSLLLKRSDYDKILKMSANEVIKYMQEGVYSEEINRFEMKYSGINLVEKALNKHLEKMFLKLKLISDPSIEYLMNQYLKRYDYWNLKTILRAKMSGLKDDEIMDMMLPVGVLKGRHLKALVEKKTAREILEASRMIEKSDYQDALQRYEDTKDLSELENLLDYHYYLDSVSFAQRIPDQGKLFKEFFKYEFDIYNLNLLLKKVVFKLDAERIGKFLIPEGKELSKRTLNTLLKCDSISSFVKELSKTSYRKVLPETSEEENLLLKYEILLQRFLLQKSILLYHQHPLTVDLVLGYMFAKEIEVRNLRVIIKSKKLEYTEDFVKELIVIK